MIEDLGGWALTLLFTAAAAGATLMIMRNMERQFRGLFGRPYGFVVEDMFRESQRRAALLARFAETRDARLARQERRLEAGR